MPAAKISIGLIADFNPQNLAALLQKNAQQLPVTCVQAPFAQTSGLLLDQKAEFWANAYDALILWTLPEIAIPSFGKALAFQGFDSDELAGDVRAFAAIVKNVPSSVRNILIPTWTAAHAGRGLGPLEHVNGHGISHALMRMNLALADELGRDRRVILLDGNSWMAASGDAAYSPRMWYLSKTPFHTNVFQEAAKDILAAIEGIRGRSKKIVILDLDNTLWGGIVGEVGWEKVRLGGHDAVGEAFADFQKGLKRLTNRGVVLAIASKNEESVALEAIRRNPEMILGIDDFVGWRINWNDKAQNIAELVSELNLGIDSAVFLDDSPFERARVREALPEVLVPEIPEDPSQYAAFLSRLRCFDNPTLSAEDRSRTKMYVADRTRTALKGEMKSLDEWLQLLDLNIEVETINQKNLDRAAQLFNKTNQMNMSTRRLPATDLLNWAETKGRSAWTFRVWDKFGDYGLCGIGSFERNGSTGRIVDFLLSCRVMGRGVEEAMLATVVQHAMNNGCETVCAEYVPTPKSQMCFKWLQSLPFFRREENRFVFTAVEPLAFPRHVRMTFN